MEIVRFAYAQIFAEIDDKPLRNYIADSTIQSPHLIISYEWRSIGMMQWLLCILSWLIQNSWWNMQSLYYELVYVTVHVYVGYFRLVFPTI